MKRHLPQGRHLKLLLVSVLTDRQNRAAVQTRPPVQSRSVGALLSGIKDRRPV